ncbi:MAG TPA: response regulator transcription factor [Anaerolineae bacterium]|nr:response regulator transcription factor [Caldilineae bacterium]HID32984.1 response regulator transcription factor [Anaerolineae bacterium]HIQ12017.1 response regulator transcription factor [Caldilineales bacterium]
MPKILIIEDGAAIVELVALYLQREGFDTVAAYDGVEGLIAVKREQPDLVILDLMLPELDGWEVCRRLRQETDIPIIMLTARGDDVDKIVGLELGADDYVTKPFNPRELVARVKAVLRRGRGAAQQGDMIHLAQLKVDSARREVRVRGELVSLRSKEFELLRTLAQQPGMVFSREQLLNQVWGYDYLGGTRTVDVHIAQLRQKIRDCGVHIETVWGVGYKLCVDA